MRFTWHEAKRESNLQDHHLDFVDAAEVFKGATFTYEDDRFAYGEKRFVTLGLLRYCRFDCAHGIAKPNPYHLLSQGDQA